MALVQVVLVCSLCGQMSDRNASLARLQARAEGTRITCGDKDSAADEAQAARLVTKPIFRYSDELREIDDAGIWLWTLGHRPVAALKVESYKTGRFPIPWLYCFASLAPERVRAEWDAAPAFVSRGPGLKWQTLGDQPLDTRAARLLQMREIARRFSAETVKDAEGKQRSQMRMLPQPLFRYEEGGKALDGALFGFTGTGTNPDLLLILDLPIKENWRFGIAGMTAEGLRMRLKDAVVFESPFTVDQGNVFDTWCNFHPTK